MDPAHPDPSQPFSDIPKRKVEAIAENNSANIEADGHINMSLDASKPDGSAYISLQISLCSSLKSVDYNLCVYTGADFTVCDSAYLTAHFGKDALKHI